MKDFLRQDIHTKVNLVKVRFDFPFWRKGFGAPAACRGRLVALVYWHYILDVCFYAFGGVSVQEEKPEVDRNVLCVVKLPY